MSSIHHPIHPSSEPPESFWKSTTLLVFQFSLYWFLLITWLRCPLILIDRTAAIKAGRAGKQPGWSIGPPHPVPSAMEVFPLCTSLWNVHSAVQFIWTSCSVSVIILWKKTSCSEMLAAGVLTTDSDGRHAGTRQEPGSLSFTSHKFIDVKR